MNELIILGAGIGISLASVLLHKTQTLRVHGSDVRTIAITLAEGDFVFTDLRIYGLDLVERYEFTEGEQVLYNGMILNNGGLENARIDVSDADTLEPLGYFLINNVGAGIEVAISAVGAVVVGTMPSKNWNVKFTLTP